MLWEEEESYSNFNFGIQVFVDMWSHFGTCV